MNRRKDGTLSQEENDHHPGGDLNAIQPLLLGSLHRRVRMLDQGFFVHPVLWEQADPDTAGSIERMLENRKWSSHQFDNPLRRNCSIRSDGHSAFNPDDAAIVTAIINMSKGLNLKVLAEGVENQEQLSFLKGQHCDEIQGYCEAAMVLRDGIALEAGESCAVGVS